MIDLDELRESEGYILAIVNTKTGEYAPVIKDVALITRCKDCKLRNDDGKCADNGVFVDDYDFCSWAERKNSNE